jgi:hypothetical protein
MAKTKQIAQIPDAEFETWREAKAVEIQLNRAKSALEVAALLAEVQRQYLYRRDEGGFGGWVENRLNMSRSLAYGLLNVHKQFGGQSVQTLDTLTHSSMLLLAAPSTPEAARTEVSEQAKKGKVSHKQVKATVAKHKPGPKRGWKHES